MTGGRRTTRGKGFSEQEIVEYNLNEATRAEIDGVLQRAASRRKFGTILSELAREFVPLLSKRPDALLEHGTEEHYAVRIWALMASTRHAINSNKANEAARWAYELGQVVREYDLKYQFERAALTGEKILKARDETRERTNRERRSDAERRHAKWQVLADAIRQSAPDLKDSEIARRIIRRLGISDSHRTVRRAIQKKVGHAG
jgi:hypothetical protein